LNAGRSGRVVHFFAFWGTEIRVPAILYADIPNELRRLIEPIVGDHGLELVDVEFSRGRPPWRLRVVVDNPELDGRVPVDRCAEVSRELGARLDAADAIETRYLLEVTTPGFDRVLAREKDFVAALGAEVRIETRRPLEGRRRFRGRLEAFEAGSLRLLVDGQPVSLPFAEVAKANRVYEFTRDDFARASSLPPAPDRRWAR
jgi:ribosome maturation factor RimP